jgi:acetylornithine deacetylase/succinyl-diaminopimelate desuccinylase-like protein
MDWQEAAEARVIELCRELIRFDTVNPPGKELGLARYIGGILEKVGLTVELVRHGEERASVLAFLVLQRYFQS